MCQFACVLLQAWQRVALFPLLLLVLLMPLLSFFVTVAGVVLAAVEHSLSALYVPGVLI